MEVAVVVPTYNERQNINELINGIFTYCPLAHIFFVDDNSPDRTWELLQTMAAKDTRLHVICRKKKDGIGSAYRCGFSEALKNNPVYVIQMDADLSHDPAVIPKLLGAAADADVVLGSRYVNGVSVINWPIQRVLLSYFANMYARVITGMKIKDITGGFKCFRSTVLNSINLSNMRSDGYYFQIEMNAIAVKLKYRIKEIPIIFVDRHSGTSKMNKGIFIEALLRVLLLPFRGASRYRKKDAE